MCGPSGTGKTFFLEALGQLAVEAGLKGGLVQPRGAGRAGAPSPRRRFSDQSGARHPARRLIVVDDIGLLPVSPDAAEGFFRLVDAAYEKRSVAVSSNVHPAGFDELMPKTLATATVDRLCITPTLMCSMNYGLLSSKPVLSLSAAARLNREIRCRERVQQVHKSHRFVAMGARRPGPIRRQNTPQSWHLWSPR